METTYVTFGQVHKHTIGDAIFDKDCVATISCKNASEGRQLTADAFGDKFFTTYHESEFDMDSMKYYPRGFLEVPAKEKDDFDPAKEFHNILFDKVQSARADFIADMSRHLHVEGKGISLDDIVKINVSAFAIFSTICIGDTKALIDRISDDIDNPDLAADVLSGILAESISLMMDDIMPSIAGVDIAKAVAEKMLQAKLSGLGDKLKVLDPGASMDEIITDLKRH